MSLVHGLTIAALLHLLVGGASAVQAAQPPVASQRSSQARAPAQGTPPAAEGRALYIAHCASCHGVSGRGDGPAADSLRRRPADLTQFARRNGGVFPAALARRIIDGRDVGAHGSVEMPVWGNVFKRGAGAASAAAVDRRIDAIVEYLEGIQERLGQ